MAIARGMILLLALVSIAIADPVHFKTCSTPVGTVNSVDVSPCDNPDLCELKKGTTPKVSINFTPKEEVTEVQVKIHAILPLVPIPVPYSPAQPDGCKDSGLSCPLKADAAQTYSYGFEILKEYPSIRVMVKYELLDQDGKDLACVMIPIKITG